MKFLTLSLLLILASCNSKVPVMTSLSGLPDPVPEEPVGPSKVLSASIESLGDVTLIHNENLIVSGSCQTSTPHGAVFVINAGPLSREVLCSMGQFTLTIPSHEIVVGDLDVYPSLSFGGEVLPGDGVFTVTKEPCDPLQQTINGACVDRVIENAYAVVDNSLVNGGGKYIPSNVAVIDYGSTMYARRAYSFSDLNRCLDFSNNNCHLGNSPAICSSIPHQVTDLSLTNRIHHMLPGFSSGVPYSVSVTYANDAHSTPCLSEFVKIDVNPPVLNLTLSNNTTHDPFLSPWMMFNNGNPARDDGIGLSGIEVGIGTYMNGTNIMPFMPASIHQVGYDTYMPPGALNPGIDYFFTVRARDLFGHEIFVSSAPWRYIPCPGGTTLGADKLCH